MPHAISRRGGNLDWRRFRELMVLAAVNRDSPCGSAASRGGMREMRIEP